MFLATAATKRPVATSALLIALVLLGLNSWRKLSLENLPGIDAPYVTITAIWPGASPEDIEKDVARRIEDAVSGVEGLKHTYSTCIENAGNVIAEFVMGTEVDVAAQDVREKIDAIVGDLPSGCQRPSIAKLDLNASAIATVFLSGDLPPDDLWWLADNAIHDRFASVKGVADVKVIGGEEREVWVELDRDALAAAGLTAAGVAQAVGQGILAVPGGRIRDSGTELAVRFDAEYHSVEEIGALQVAGADGARRYLRDLGTVRIATEEPRQRAFLDGMPGIAIKVVKKSDGNTVETVRLLKKRFAELQKELPPGVSMRWLQDDAEIVQANVNNTLSDIGSSVLLCAFILFVFLVNLRSTFVVAVTMPITIVISLFFMQLCGLTLNLSTLLAIGLSAGILVSNSIVVLESIVRRFSTANAGEKRVEGRRSKVESQTDENAGHSTFDKGPLTSDVRAARWTAARDGAAEQTVAILASAGTNVVVMLPIAMMSSIVGKFFVPFATTTLIVNLASIFVSFTLTPMLCALVMKPESEQTGRLARWGRAWDATLTRWGSSYGAWLRRIGSRRGAHIIAALALAVLLVASLRFGTKGLGFLLIENDDWARAFIRLEFPDYYDLARTQERTLDLARRIGEDPDAVSVLAMPGRADAIAGQAGEGVYLAQIEIVYKPASERPERGIDAILENLRAELRAVPDLISTVSMPSYVQGLSATIQYNLKGPDLDELTTRAQRIQALALGLPGLAQIDTTGRDDKPEIRVMPDRAVMADMGLDAATVGALVRANVDGIEAASYKEDLKTIDVRVRLAEREGAEQIASLPLPAAPGRPVPLSAFTDEVRTGQKVMIFRHDKERAILIGGNERPGYAAGTVGKQIEALAHANNVVGDGYALEPIGTTEMIGESVADFGEAIVLAVVLTLLTLSAILESWRKPFLVLATIPMALIGLLWALQLGGLNVSIFVLLGAVMLIGVVVNPAVLIVDKASQLEQAGEDNADAICHGVAQTFRAVVMVIVASGLGMLPIALSTGIGAVNRIGIGAASVGGILIAGALTLLVLPFFGMGRRVLRHEQGDRRHE
ncbi:MAG: efflux RND transporter permease subunit [Kiritimatiellae bacterium]|nr:efflux RND transporter permease subunit [Kiritimatiellia bacterium]